MYLNQKHAIKGLPLWSGGWDFAFQSRGCRFDPWSEAKIPHLAARNKQTNKQNIKQKHYCDKFDKPLKIVHILKNKNLNVPLKKKCAMFISIFPIRAGTRLVFTAVGFPWTWHQVDKMILLEWMNPPKVSRMPKKEGDPKKLPGMEDQCWVCNLVFLGFWALGPPHLAWNGNLPLVTTDVSRHLLQDQDRTAGLVLS